MDRIYNNLWPEIADQMPTTPTGLSVALIVIEKDNYDNIDIVVWHQDNLTPAQADAVAQLDDASRDYVVLKKLTCDSKDSEFLASTTWLFYWMMEPMFEELMEDNEKSLRASELAQLRPDLCCLFKNKLTHYDWALNQKRIDRLHFFKQ